ncbi:hypothetical protein FKM82_023560 [Ascaphus truei]
MHRLHSSFSTDLQNPEAGQAPTLCSDSPVPVAPPQPLKGPSGSAEVTPDPELEKKLLHHLSDLSLVLPADSVSIQLAIASPKFPVTRQSVESLLQKFAAQELIEVKGWDLEDDDRPAVVTFADRSKLSAMMGAVTERKGPSDPPGAKKRRLQEPDPAASSLSSSSAASTSGEKKTSEPQKKARKQASHLDLEIESLLSQQSTKEQQSKKMSREILELLNASTAKEQSIVEKFRSRGRAQVQEFCDYGTKEECMRGAGADMPCRRLHFRAMELGRECLKLWGYERVDEIIWVKTNQLQRIIRTGRTGHWLNHGKEHCLVTHFNDCLVTLLCPITLTE